MNLQILIIKFFTTQKDNGELIKGSKNSGAIKKNKYYTHMLSLGGAVA